VVEKTYGTQCKYRRHYWVKQLEALPNDKLSDRRE
jgi:hypothetical protein